MTVLEWLQEVEEEERIVKVGCVDNTLRGPRHAPAAAGPAALRALPLLGHRAVPAVWPQHTERFLQPRRKMR